MASLFEGSPQTATSYTTSNTESPKWLQDAIYNQIQVASNIANTPYQEYAAPRVAELSPLQKQAYQQVQQNQGAWKPEMDFASQGMQDFAGKGTAEGLTTAQGQYLRPGMVSQALDAGQNYFGQAGQQNIVGAAQPYMTQAGSTTAEALSDRALNAASPYLQAAAGTAAGGISDYMSPYQTGVMDVLAKQGTRNLTENLLPGVSDAFIKAGQFGSGRMGEFGSRALRDTQEAVLNQQAQLANQGYGQALSASQADLARQAQLAGTVGSISGADLSRVLQGGAQYGQLGQTAGQLTAQQMQGLTGLGQAQTAAGQAQQQFGLTAAQAAQQAQAADYQRQMGALTGVANMAQQAQGMRTGDVAALEAAGLAQQGQQQQQLNAAYEQSQAPQNYLKNQADWLSTQVRGMAPLAPTSTSGYGSTTGATYAPSGLSQLATALYAGKGLSSLG
jgi:hypothetical protein